MENKMINYTNKFTDTIAAHGSGNNFLILRKLDTPLKRFDGQRASYEIEYRWLSETCENESDEAWACCQGQEFTYWLRKELPISEIKKPGFSLFDHFNLF